MEFLRRYWTQIQTQLPQLSLQVKWLVGLIVLLLLLTGFLVVQYAASPERVTVTTANGAEQAEIISRLKAEGINATTAGSQVLVPSSQKLDAIAVLAQASLLSDDPAKVFDDYFAQQTPWTSNRQNAEALLQAKQKFLGRVINRMKDVRSAQVVLDMPQNQGFAQTHRQPSASVFVELKPGRSLNQTLVTGIASWVSGAIAELEKQDVKVVDAATGRAFEVLPEDQIQPSQTLELVQVQERAVRDKILQTLAYIPGVIVAVNVRIDPTRSEEVESYAYEKNEPMTSDSSREEERKTASDAGEPGVRSNTGANIASGASAGQSEKITETTTLFGPKPLVSKSYKKSSGNLPRQVAVTINVPRSYFVQVWHQTFPPTPAPGSSAGGVVPGGATAAQPEPDDATLRPVIEAQLKVIEAQVKPLVSAENEGVVAVHMIPDSGVAMASLAAPSSGFTAVFSGGSGGLGGEGISGWAKPAGLGVLALTAVGLMLGMVRKATSRPPIPTAEELAGVPPILPTPDDLVGEVDAAETTMDGVELDDVEIRHRKIAEQIADMVKSNPREAAHILSKWVHTDE
ncbi:MAG: hypothetical protein IT441_10240 [Phycisphaeraceae bacterium]|nr:hypothetical protein [Phycisphaeraceae bacterium]